MLVNSIQACFVLIFCEAAQYLVLPEPLQAIILLCSSGRYVVILSAVITLKVCEFMVNLMFRAVFGM